MLQDLKIFRQMLTKQCKLCVEILSFCITELLTYLENILTWFLSW